ncbi:hypothetical protein Tco_0627886 [Tanacetum coccineum]|uniref:Uncharacterized protein n=1 Tax=Tanacetum coccineum TaxID=301880 RepID=A0ABQ4WNT3_9ASTR
MESLNSISQEREMHQLQQMQDKAKESCMISFRLLHSHLKVLSIKGGSERACVALFDQDTQTFIESLLLNLDNLEKQLDREEFQETKSIDAFRVLMNQFQTFINFRCCFDDFDGAMLRKSFLAYTRTEIQQFRDTLIHHIESLQESIQERAKHKREYERRMNDRMMQSKEGKVDSSKALDAGLVVTESNETKSERHVSSADPGKIHMLRMQISTPNTKDSQDVPTEASPDPPSAIPPSAAYMLNTLSELTTQVEGHRKVKLENDQVILARNKQNAKLKQETESLKTTLRNKEATIAHLTCETKTVLSEKKTLEDKWRHRLVQPGHARVTVHDSDETLLETEVSRMKMSQKPGHVKPIDYAKLNALYDQFVPQKELSREQAYWLSATDIASLTSDPPKPIINMHDTSMHQSHFEINKLRDQLQGKDATIRNLDAQINIMKVLNVGSTKGSCDQQALDTDRIQLKDMITSLRIQLDGLKAENVNLKRRYEELSKSNAYSRSTFTAKINALTAENAKLKTELSGKKCSGSISSEKPSTCSGCITNNLKIMEPIVEPLELTPSVSSSSKVTMISRFTDCKLSDRKAGSKGISGFQGQPVADSIADKIETTTTYDQEGRRKIFALHLKNVLMQEDKEYICDYVASNTEGFVGAGLAEIVAESLGVAGRRGGEFVTFDDILQALDRTKSST